MNIIRLRFVAVIFIRISKWADTIVDETGEYFFQIRVRTAKNYLGQAENPLPIMPGMIATVDISTGEKTVMDYLLKPLKRATASALTER